MRRIHSTAVLVLCFASNNIAHAQSSVKKAAVDTVGSGDATLKGDLTFNPVDDLQKLLAVFGLQPPRHQVLEYQKVLVSLLSNVNGLPVDPSYYERQRQGAQAAVMLTTGAWSTGELPRDKATSLYGKIATFFLRPLANELQMKGTAEATGICSAVQGAVERACRMHYCVGPGGNEPDSLADALGQFNSSCYPIMCSTYRCPLDEQSWTQLQTEFDSLYAAQAGIALASTLGAHAESASLRGALGSWAGRLSDAENAAEGDNFAYIISGAALPAMSVRQSVAETLTRYLDATDATVLAAPVKNLVAAAERTCSKAAESGTATDFAQCSDNLNATAPLIEAGAVSP